MKIQRVSGTWTRGTAGDALLGAVGGPAGLARTVKATVYLPDRGAASHGDTRAALAAAGYTGAAEVITLDPLEHPAQALLAAWLAPAGTDLHVPAPDVTVARTASVEVAWFGNAGGASWPVEPGDYDAVFAGARDKLQAAGMGPAQLWKTWSYLPVDAATGRADEAFTEFNRRRAAWFGGVGFDIAAAAGGVPFGFPANTGVGDLAGRFSLSGIAGRARDAATRVVEVDNPNQQTPRLYGTGASGRRAPAQFSRAVAVLGGHDPWVLVAGTASVVGSSTSNIDAVSEQTTQTLAHLVTLAQVAGGREAGPVAPPAGEVYSNLVVYVTNPGHFETVRQVVGTLAAQLPVTYLRCPLTRKDLLVEMEGDLR